MKEYILPALVRWAIRDNEPAVKAALCRIANAKFGRDDALPQGIYKCEGGVRVNDREICIKGDYVIDDGKVGIDPTPEEEAVVDALMQVRDSIVRNEGTEALEKQYGRCESGAPLEFLMNGPVFDSGYCRFLPTL